MSEKKPDPIRKSVAELETDGYVDRMIAEYEPVKKKTGDYYKFTLEYITNEDTYMTSETEKEFISEYGLAPIGLLEILRMHMCRKNGFGICTTNKDLQKVFFEINIDYEIDLEKLQEYYNLLLDNKLIVEITDSKGQKYATTPQQIFNWETKYCQRYNERVKKQKTRAKAVKQKTSSISTVDLTDLLS